MSAGDVTVALAALSRLERHALVVALAQLRDEDVEAGRHGRAAVWSALLVEASEVADRERQAFDDVERGFWSGDVSDGGDV